MLELDREAASAFMLVSTDKPAIGSLAVARYTPPSTFSASLWRSVGSTSDTSA